MVGTSSGTAPYSRSRSETADACSLVRGTSTRQPNSGLVSYQDSRRCAAAAVADHGDGAAAGGGHGHARRLEVGPDPAERGHDRLLLGGGPVPGDRERRRVGPAGGDQHLAEVGGAVSAPRTTSVPGAVADLAHLVGVHDPQLATALGGQRDARVGGDAGRGGHAGHDLEPNLLPWRTPAPRRPRRTAAGRRAAAGRPAVRPAPPSTSDLAVSAVPDGSASTASAATRCRTRSATSASATTRAAAPSSRAPRTVSSPSSPGPAPTNATQPSISVMRIIPVGLLHAHQAGGAEGEHPRRQLASEACRV